MIRRLRAEVTHAEASYALAGGGPRRPGMAWLIAALA